MKAAVAPVELMTPVVTVAQVLDDLPLTMAHYVYGLRAHFDKQGLQSFKLRVTHISYRLGAPRQFSFDTSFSTPFHEDELTGASAAWFLAEERPLVVDTDLVHVPPSVSITRGSRVIIHFLAHVVRPRKIGFLPTAIQVIELAEPSDPKLPFERIPDGYRYVATDGAGHPDG